MSRVFSHCLRSSSVPSSPALGLCPLRTSRPIFSKRRGSSPCPLSPFVAAVAPLRAARYGPSLASRPFLVHKIVLRDHERRGYRWRPGGRLSLVTQPGMTDRLHGGTPPRPSVGCSTVRPKSVFEVRA